ncbi:hypothetical protein BDB01DRAFT_793206 [Pilobolus umbonatus]|nr:hypothetical protein BDB01DRAFT_793206 [Pilobolus umbonatus]
MQLIPTIVLIIASGLHLVKSQSDESEESDEPTDTGTESDEPTASSVSSQTISATPTKINIVSCTSCNSYSTPTSDIHNDTIQGSAPLEKLDENQIGVILVCTISALFVVIVLSCMYCVNRKRRLRDIQATQGMSSSYEEEEPKSPRFLVFQGKSEQAIKTYNMQSVIGNEIGSSHLDPRRPNIISPEPSHSARSKHARLSKYAFLTEVFSQRKASVNTRTPYPNEKEIEMKNQSKSTDIIVSTPITNQSEYSFNEAVNSDTSSDVLPLAINNSSDSAYRYKDNTISQIIQKHQKNVTSLTPSYISTDNGRESTLTVGTLHAPLFRQHFNKKDPKSRGTEKSSLTGINESQKLTSLDEDTLKKNSLRTEINQYASMSEPPSAYNPEKKKGTQFDS